MKSKGAVEIKGSKKGFVLILQEGLDLVSYLMEIENKWKEAQGFFDNAVFSEIRCDALSENDKILLRKFLEEHHQVTFQKEPLEEKKEKSLWDHEIYKKSELPAKFITDTVRSGTNLQFDGHIIIIGDVNPGAKVEATGNILVLGHFRGIAHAGAKGDAKAFVLAQRLAPLQLRIGNFLAIAPDDPSRVEECLLARIIGENIVIEPYYVR